MENKIKKIVIIVLFVGALVLNYFYGSLFFAKITGQNEAYYIGKVCNTDRALCEKTYFKDYLDEIESLSNKSRTFFSDMFIEEDQYYYTGNCPCPYDSDSRGGYCGGRSSYSKSGKISYCYDSDVSDSQISRKRNSMIAEVREELNGAVKKDLRVYHEKYTLIFIVIVFGGLWFYFNKK